MAEEQQQEIVTPHPEEKVSFGAERFFGGFPRNIDVAGRVTIPLDFREGGLKKVVMSAWVLDEPQYLLVCEPPFWREVILRLVREEKKDLSPREAIRLMTMRTRRLTVDSQGRVFVPDYIREDAGLTPGQKAYALGYGDYFEVWGAQQLERADEVLIERMKRKGSPIPEFLRKRWGGLTDNLTVLSFAENRAT